MLEATKNQPQYSVLMSPRTKQPEQATNTQTNVQFRIHLRQQKCSGDQDKSFISFYSSHIRRNIIGSKGFQWVCG